MGTIRSEVRSCPTARSLWERVAGAGSASLALLAGALIAAGSGGVERAASAEIITYEYGGVSDVLDIEFTPSGRGWAVGAGGIGEWNGTSWRRNAASELLGCLGAWAGTLAAVDFVDDEFGLAVGPEGLLFSYANGRWAREPPFTDKDLRDVAVVSRAEAWVVGDGIWHYGEGHWNEVSTDDAPPWDVVLHSLVLSSPTSGWAVGSGIVLRYVGGRWGAAGSGWPPGEFPADLREVAIGPGPAVWAVGAEGAIWRHDEAGWRAVPSPTQADLLAVAFDDKGSGWIGVQLPYDVVGEAPLLHYDGASWRTAEVACLSQGVSCPFEGPGSAGSSSLQSRVSDVLPVAVYAVAFGGGYGWAGGNSVLIDLSGYPVAVVGDDRSVQSLSVVSATEGLAVGESGLILRGTEGGWSRVASPTSADLFAIEATDTDTAWAVGPGLVLRLSVDGWHREATPDGVLYDLSMNSPESGWAVGRRWGDKQGLVLTRQGELWQTVYDDPQPDTALYAVDMSDSHSGWAVGMRGTIVRFDDGQWSRAMSSTEDDLFLVSAVSDDLAWAAGGEVLLEWDGADWRSLPLPDPLRGTGRYVTGMVLRERNDGWLLARGGWFDRPLLLHFDGSSWNQEDQLPCSAGQTPRMTYDDTQPFFLWFMDEFGAVYRRRTSARPGYALHLAYLPRVQ